MHWFKRTNFRERALLFPQRCWFRPKLQRHEFWNVPSFINKRVSLQASLYENIFVNK
jgi:hypothetical protein